MEFLLNITHTHTHTHTGISLRDNSFSKNLNTVEFYTVEIIKSQPKGV